MGDYGAGPGKLAEPHCQNLFHKSKNQGTNHFMTTKAYNTKGPVFKLALEHGKNAEQFALPRERYRSTLPRLPEKAGKKLTMARLRERVAAGEFSWCMYSVRCRVDDIEGWIVGTDDTGSDWACFSAPSPATLEDMRQEKRTAAALAGGSKKAVPKTLVKSLVEAMREGDRETVEKLAPVAARGTFEEKDEYGSEFSTKRPMIEAAFLDRPLMLELLAPHANLEVVDGDGKNALHHAIEAEKLANVKVLVEAGANAGHADNYGTTPLMRAARRSRAIVDLLLPHSDANAVDNEGCNALMAAIDAEDADNVEALCPATDLDARNKKGATALMMSIRPDRVEGRHYSDRRRDPLRCAEILCKASSDIDAVDSEGNTALMRLVSATERGFSSGHAKPSQALMKTLLDAGADPGKAYANGDSLLTFAARNQLHVYFDLLLPLLGARHVGEHGDTALILAARNADLERVRTLSAISDARAANADGETALLACFGNKADDLGRVTNRVFAFLHLLPLSDVKAQGAKGHTALMKLVLAGQPELFALALPGSDPNQQDADGMNALMHAAGAGNELLFDRLVPITDLSAKDAEGKTALMHASSARRVAALLGGSEVDHQDKDGRTALMHAVNCYSSRESEIVRLLLDVADARIKDNNGLTAADIARESENGSEKLIASVAHAQHEREEISKASGKGKGKTPTPEAPPKRRSKSI